MSEQQQSLPIKFEPIVEKLGKLFESLPEEQRTEVTTALLPYVESVSTLCEMLPLIIKGTTAADKAMQKITELEDDEDVEHANGLLAKVRESYEVNSARRKQITEPGDALKTFLMQFEKKVSTDAKEKNHYNRVRMLIQSFQQEKLEKVRKAEAAAALVKKKKDYAVDLELAWMKKLAEMLSLKVSQADSGSKAYFDNTPLETFDERAATFKAYKPKLKEADYIACFAVVKDPTLITDEEFTALVEEFKKKESYEKWNSLVVEKTTPTIDLWKGKIDSIKAEKLAIAQAKDEETKKRLEEEKRVKDEREQKLRDQQIKEEQEKIEIEANREAGLKKMENTFQEQAVVQKLEDPGLVKKVLRFKTDEDAPKALAEIIYHVFLSPKFKGIYKLNQQKERVKDNFGRDQYNDWVLWLTDFCVKNCDVLPTGCVIEEESKVRITS